jgi:hypothetical protein
MRYAFTRGLHAMSAVTDGRHQQSARDRTCRGSITAHTGASSRHWNMVISTRPRRRYRALSSKVMARMPAGAAMNLNPTRGGQRGVEGNMDTEVRKEALNCEGSSRW